MRLTFIQSFIPPIIPPPWQTGYFLNIWQTERGYIEESTSRIFFFTILWKHNRACLWLMWWKMYQGTNFSSNMHIMINMHPTSSLSMLCKHEKDTLHSRTSSLVFWHLWICQLISTSTWKSNLENIGTFLCTHYFLNYLHTKMFELLPNGKLCVWFSIVRKHGLRSFMIHSSKVQQTCRAYYARSKKASHFVLGQHNLEELFHSFAK